MVEKSTVAMTNQNKADFAKRIKTLSTDGSSMRGRDANLIVADCDQLKLEIEASSLPSKKKLLKEVSVIRNDAESEEKMEKMCGKCLQRGILLITFGPLLLTLLGSLTERAMRPTMVVETRALSGDLAVITGGCGDLGSRLAVKLASSGCTVIAACHETTMKETTNENKQEQEEDAEEQQEQEEQEEQENFGSTTTTTTTTTLPTSMDTRTAALNRFLPYLATNDKDKDKDSSSGSISVWDLDLASFASVDAFAARFLKHSDSLDMLIHAAAIREDEASGCTKSLQDHVDTTLQINYLSPWLLTRRLMPALRNAENEENGDGGRITYVTCSEGLALPDYLPWPLRRTHPSALPNIHNMMNDANVAFRNTGTTGKSFCSPRVQYMNSKLAIAIHSRDLDARFERNPNNKNIVSNVVDPGGLDNVLGRKLSKSKPKARQSLRAKMFSYFPPVWIMKKIYNFIYEQFDLGGSGLRTLETGVDAVYHVATSLHLSTRGGGVYSDQSGTSFINCGLKKKENCGLIRKGNLPIQVVDSKVGTDLFKWTKKIVLGVTKNKNPNKKRRKKQKKENKENKEVIVEVEETKQKEHGGAGEESQKETEL